ncbi:MAG: hypothetical protein K2N35_12785, partial [Muribaculaceae bacterium]|nr:hypothetical protein [Muribaculaceae bacterium]
MKTIKYILCIFLFSLSLTCSAQRVLSEVASMKGVSSVFIGKNMLKIAGGASITISGKRSGIDMSKLFK